MMMSTRARQLTLPWAALGLSLLIGAACATGGAASKGHEAATRGDWDTAVAYYRQALQENPDRLQAKIGLERATREASLAHLQRARKLEGEEQISGAIAEYRLAAEYDPSNSLALSRALALERQLRDQLEASRPKSRMDEMRQQAAQQSPIPRLDPRTPLPGLKFNNSSIRDILNTIGTSTGINVTYDTGLDGMLTRPYTLDVTDMPLEAVLNQVLAANQLLFKVIDSRTIFIYQDTPQKRGQYEDLYQQIFYVSHADVQEVTQILNQMLTTTTAGGSRPVITQHKTLNAINVRATAPMMALIKNIIDTADKPRAEVLIDVSILEVSRSRLKELGLDLTTYAIGLTFSPNSAPNNIPLQSPPFALGTGAQRGDFYATVPSAIIRFLEQDTKTRLLAKPQLRGREGAQLTLNLGDDIPIPQTTFQAAAAGGVQTIPQTSWTYRSVGVNLQMTPRVTYQDEIILDPLVVDKSGLGPYIDVAGQSLPSFVKRTASVAMRLRDGESNLLAGLIKEEDREVAKSIPGILNVPILRSIFGSTDTTTDQSDIVMIVTPHIIRSREITTEDLRPLYVGTSNNLGAGTTPTLISPNAPPPPVIAPPGQPGQPPAAGAATPPAAAAAPPATTGTPPATAAPPTRAPGVVAVQPVGGAPAPPAAGAQLLVTVPASEFQMGGPPYTVPVSITNVSQLGSVTLTVTYDPKVLRATSVAPGTFMQQGGVTPTFLPKIDAAAGRIDVAITRTGSSPGASGTGLLAGLVFEAVGAGSTRIAVTGVAMSPTGQAIPLQMTPATVVVK